MTYRIAIVAVAMALWIGCCLFPRHGNWTRVGGQDDHYGYPWIVCTDQGDVRQDELLNVSQWNFIHLASNAVVWGIPIGGGAAVLFLFSIQRSRLTRRCA